MVDRHEVEGHICRHHLHIYSCHRGLGAGGGAAMERLEGEYGCIDSSKLVGGPAGSNKTKRTVNGCRVVER